MSMCLNSVCHFSQQLYQNTTDMFLYQTRRISTVARTGTRTEQVSSDEGNVKLKNMSVEF